MPSFRHEPRRHPRRTMNPNKFLTAFFAELERLVNGAGARHAISLTQTGELEVRLGADDL